MYAIVRTGGKQYRVEEGRSLTVERLPAAEGDTVELTDVLLIADNGNVTVGAPLIEGARVLAQVETNGRGKKIIVFKYKSKVRARKKTGHRQNFTKLSVTEILAPGQSSKAKPKRAPRPKAEDEVEAPEAEVEVEAPEAVAAPEVEAAVEAPETEAAVEEPAAEVPKPRARRAAAKPEPKARKAPEPKARAAKPKAKKEEKPKRGKAEKQDDKPKASRRLPLPRRKKNTEK